MSLHKKSHYIAIPIISLLLTFFLQTAAGQQKQNTVAPLLTQKFSRHDRQRLGYGGTVTIVGPPVGSVIIEGWANSEVEILAEIELQAPTEDDLKRLTAVNGFILDVDLNHLRIITAGTHDKNYMRRVAKGFPKKLLGLPWKIDYRIRVPLSTDIEIDTGHGPVSVSGVEGALRLSAAQSETKLSLTGGTVNATIGTGKVKLSIPVRSWRGAGAEVRLAAGTLEVEVTPGFSADIDAEILRSGSIQDEFGLEPRVRSGITATSAKARAGVGGTYFHFVVGDGTIKFTKLSAN